MSTSVYPSLLTFEFFTNNDYRLEDERRDTSAARIPPFGLIIVIIQPRFE
ncbi:hypothetical protein NIES22_72690 (plasmid) [Calothrix brevissima NIES-22]|nr:hypothetical protein NIES22_72690 [Calothrix brevissima NIES-22]